MTMTTAAPIRKTAETHHPVHDLIRERWSPRAFDDRPIERAKLHSLFEAARWAADAPVLVLVVGKLYDRPGKEYASLYDVGMAVGNLVTQAVDLGLVTHQMGGFDGDKAHELLGIPHGYAPIAVIALGYLGSPDALPDDLRERETSPRDRKPIEEFVFEGRWDQPAPDVAT